MFDLLGFGANGWGPALLRAALMTLGLSAAGFISGVALGVLAAFARFSGGTNSPAARPSPTARSSAACRTC